MVTTEEQVKTIKKYHFSCDRCGREIGYTIEQSDGWYDILGEYTAKMFIGGKWYGLNACLCDDCKRDKDADIINTLKSIGFTEGC